MFQKKIYSTFFIAFFISSFSINVTAQKRKILGFAPLSDTITSEKQGTFLLPLLYFTPDTRWAAGAAGVYYFKLPPKTESEKETRTNFVQFLADYTQNRQTDVWASWNVFTRNENFLLKGDIRYRNFPDRFYGIGNQTTKEAAEKYEYNLLQLKTMFLKQIKHDFFIGIDYELEKEYQFQLKPNGQLAAGNIVGYRGGLGSALGLVSILDTRDNVINSYKGKLIELSSYYFSRQLGSSFQFLNCNALYQQYWQIKPKHILAFQSKLKLSFGEVPFLDMATLGNDDILRGYPKNRFRDHHFAASQVEYRFPLFWRLGATTFAGLGDVFHYPEDLKMNRLKFSLGGGVRFVVNPAERLNIRLDYAHGKEGGYFYFMVGEAF